MRSKIRDAGALNVFFVQCLFPFAKLIFLRLALVIVAAYLIASISGCFRTVKLAQAYCRISSYLTTMENLGCNPLIAISIALKGEAVAYLKKHAKNEGK